MATILLQAAGAALGGIFGPVGAIVGRAAGAFAGAAVDRALIGGETVSGPRLKGGRIPTSDEGAGIIRLHGTARIAGNLIWATRFEEEVTSERRGGKAGGGTVERFAYYANFAVGLCEGPIAGIRRIWADGRELDQTEIEFRLYRGEADQQPDPLIEAKQGAENTPAYRGLAYVVFERLPLDRFGNRIPVLHFEVMRPVGLLERELRAVTIIPGATEHGYSPVQVTETVAEGEVRIMNRHTLVAATDWTAALDELQALCPKLEAVALVCTWFGTDLRAAHCAIRPGVEVSERREESIPWSVAGFDRATAHLVSRRADAPAFGGTPSDASVIAAIADLKARGLKVFFYPFLMMDVPEENALPDPHGGASQPAYPWRGDIVCDPAPGRPGTTDGTPAARTQVEAFCGTAAAADFEVTDGAVTFVGADEGYRRLVLHYAHLAVLAGGVDGFLVGSEMRGLTRVRDEIGAFPFVGALGALADDVRAIIGPETAISYAADWSEFAAHTPADGSGDLFFNLDPLWMRSSVSAIGIDNYMPLADWRDEDLVDGNPDGFVTPTDVEALEAQIAGGEGFDWFYADEAARKARLRSPFEDGAAGKPWVFRTKDLVAWWSNHHYERRGGVELAEPTAWVPGAKPIWFTELGCPAIDKGANQPNVFPDVKRASQARPHFSGGGRSDLIQRRFLEAHLAHWQEAAMPEGMLDPARIFAWSWDARPFPAFPANGSIWNDGANWTTGHWLNGRLGQVAAADLVKAVLAGHGFGDFDVEDLGTDIAGHVQSDPASARSVLEPLLDLLQADAVESRGRLLVRSRTRRHATAITIDAVVDEEDAPLVETTRAQVAELVNEAVLEHFDPRTDYEPAVARSRRLESGSDRQRRLSLPVVMEETAAAGEAELWLRDHWSGSGRIGFALPPTALAVEAGDLLVFDDMSAEPLIVQRVEDGSVRAIEGRTLARATPTGEAGTGRGLIDAPDASAAWEPAVELLDLPVLEGADEMAWMRAAAFSRPWRPIDLRSSMRDEGYESRLTLAQPARMGTLLAPLAPARSAGRFDEAAELYARLQFGAPSSADDLTVLNGANALAVEAANGAWEVLQFVHAEETAAGEWRLRRLLRGQAGSEDAMTAGAAEGARVVLLDRAVQPLPLRRSEIGRAMNWRAVRRSETRSVATERPLGVRAQMSLAPVHLAAERLANGDIGFAWVRRGRFDADDWTQIDIPLDAAVECYRLDILDAGEVVRSIEAVTPGCLYPAAEELADFGAPQTEISVRVRQYGDRVPLGLPAEATLAV